MILEIRACTKIGYSEQLNKSLNKSSIIIAILHILVDRALLTIFIKSIMLSLMTLFLGIFLTDFCILHILSQILNNFHNILEEKHFINDFFCFFYVNSIVFLTYKEISMRYIHSLQNKMHI